MGLLYVRNAADDGWEQINSSAGHKIYDADWDTTIQCEESADEDIIRFEAGSVEVGRWDATSLTMPVQPAYSVNFSGLTGTMSTNTTYELPCDVEVFDIGSNYDTGTNRFTAPATGKYQISWSVYFSTTVDTDAQYYKVELITSNRTYRLMLAPKYAADANYHSVVGSVVADMDASDTAYVTYYQQGGAAQTEVNGSYSWIHGFKLS